MALMRTNFDAALAKSQLSGQVQTTCSTDMRDKVPACHQLGTMWCWATAVAQATVYYGHTSLALAAGGAGGAGTGAAGTGADDQSGSQVNQCAGLECGIVGWTFSKECCPAPVSPEGDLQGACGDKGAGEPEK